MNILILTPPIAFIIILLVSWALSAVSIRLGYKNKTGEEGALTTPYTGGELVPTSRVQPDYSQFFPFAFFFTILHVVALMVATVPTETPGSFVIAFIYIAGAMLGLYILFRRQS